ncbi:hypothetical protein BV25DRAFT_1912398 [Artomyces pyxidatus]|uniref:Uncharacterized protein n=1 Tax=Artomyces pyxidatus TaxID=48021 RepID=A0ACB8TF62_9AGAM|nr:hypothetical protein BV25DRAFT_1912398 [Artomyces pyxidatus]
MSLERTLTAQRDAIVDAEATLQALMSMKDQATDAATRAQVLLDRLRPMLRRLLELYPDLKQGPTTMLSAALADMDKHEQDSKSKQHEEPETQPDEDGSASSPPLDAADDLEIRLRQQKKLIADTEARLRAMDEATRRTGESTTRERILSEFLATLQQRDSDGRVAVARLLSAYDDIETKSDWSFKEALTVFEKRNRLMRSELDRVRREREEEGFAAHVLRAERDEMARVAQVMRQERDQQALAVFMQGHRIQEQERVLHRQARTIQENERRLRRFQDWGTR